MKGAASKGFLVKTFCLMCVVGGPITIIQLFYCVSNRSVRLSTIDNSNLIRNRTPSRFLAVTEQMVSAVGNKSTVQIQSEQNSTGTLSGWQKHVHWEPGAKLDIFEFVINPVDTCKDGNNNITLLALIKSAPGNTARRDAVRKTYVTGASRYNVSARFLFIIGDSEEQDTRANIREEAQTHGDILLVNFRDQYYNLTMKLIMGFKWILNYCINIEFMMSVDDDVMVDVVTLIKDLEALLPKDRSQFVLGRLATGWAPQRFETSKWYMPNDQYPDKFYPPFPLGHGYVLSHDVVEKLYLISKETPAKVPFDDVYCGILLHKLGIGIVDRKPWHKDRHPQQKHDYFNIELTARSMEDAWKTLENGL